ncbi:MAG: tetraacyldisaccharide 4'-kinase, partial [Candidatus Omnitrophica bacterium]|nr:tetraacyldisaccharide 4'-kinase [Candidatus Omnitrophota bacterium]
EKNVADVFLLDDGFQHWRLLRDIDIVAIDAMNPWGNGHLLPRGILRESKTALSRAHIFVLTKIDLGNERLVEIKSDLHAVNPKALIVEAIHKPVLFWELHSKTEFDLVTIRGQKVATVCSIGSPNSFIKTLVELEANIDEHFAFMDHHVYCAVDVERIVELCQKQGIATIVTTEKDAVKLGPFMSMFPDYISVLVLKIEISIVSGEDVFLERIYHIL